MKLYQQIASLIEARANCAKSNNREWLAKHEEALRALADNFLPSGAGLDADSVIDLRSSTPDRLVITTSFHHMDDVGSYDGWTDHEVIVTPSLAHGITLRITGRNRNDIKDYLGDVFHEALCMDASEPAHA